MFELRPDTTDALFQSRHPGGNGSTRETRIPGGHGGLLSVPAQLHRTPETPRRWAGTALPTGFPSSARPHHPARDVQRAPVTGKHGDVSPGGEGPRPLISPPG